MRSTQLLNTLTEWEERFAPQVRSAQLRLLGELEVSEEECQHIGALIGRRYKSLSRQRALNYFRKETPCTFAAFLVAQGIFGYKAGDYWSGVHRAVELRFDPILQTKWGQTFESILEDLSLPLFSEIVGHRYLRAILAHGGIPNYSLNDFFRLLLHPAVTRPHLIGLETPELIEELLHRSATGFADEPVQRFLQYGGRVAENFFERCCAMATEFLETGAIPEPVELGLPRRVVTAYREWVSTQEKIEQRARHLSEVRWRKPSIVFDPWGRGVTAYLPPQFIQVADSQSQYSWIIENADRSKQIIHVRVKRTGGDLRTVDASPALESPASHYSISLTKDGAPQRTWRFAGLSPDRPLWLFDANNGNWLNWSESITAQHLWALFPVDCDLAFEGPGQVVGLPECFGDWAYYRAQEIDLTQATKLTLRRGETILDNWPVRRDDPQQRPHFVGGSPLPIPQPTRRTTLYIGRPPVLRVPLSGKHSVEAEMAVWRLMLHSRESASPALHKVVRLTELRTVVVSSNGTQFIEVPLDTPDLLGPSPYGTYDLRLRGSLGQDAELILRVWPYLSVSMPEPIYLPDPHNGPPEAVVRINSESGDRLDCPSDEGRMDSQSLDVGASIRYHTIHALPQTTLLGLTLSRPTPSGAVVRIPFEIPIPRMRWLLLDESAPEQLPD